MEGNQMKMREALLEIAKVADDWERYSPTKAGTIDRIYELANAALSEPPRNCDVGTPEEQHRRFIDYCNTCDCPMGCIYRKEFTGMLDTRCASMLKCYIRWAQTPYEAQEGGAE